MHHHHIIIFFNKILCAHQHQGGRCEVKIARRTEKKKPPIALGKLKARRGSAREKLKWIRWMVDDDELNVCVAWVYWKPIFAGKKSWSANVALIFTARLSIWVLNNNGNHNYNEQRMYKKEKKKCSLFSSSAKAFYFFFDILIDCLLPAYFKANREGSSELYMIP